MGSFGVSWSDSCLNTAAAIMKLVLVDYYPKARRLGIDLFDESGAFRSWLEKCPMPDWCIVRANEAVKTYELRRKTKGVEDWMMDYADAAYIRFADEIAVAMFTDNKEPGMIPVKVLDSILPLRKKHQPLLQDHPRKFGWWRERTGNVGKGDMCHCRRDLLVSFFPYHIYRRCYGCMLLDILTGEDDHLKKWRHLAIKNWLVLGDQRRTLKEALDAMHHYMYGLLTAQKTDIVHVFEKDHPHRKLAWDIHWHIDYTQLHRRYRRSEEPHDGLDRRKEDMQYKPVGLAGFGVTLDMLPQYHYFGSRYTDQEILRIRTDVPTWTAEQGRFLDLEEFMERCSVMHSRVLNVESRYRHQISYVDNLERQCIKDRRLMATLHREYQARTSPPNHPAQDWDEKRKRHLECVERESRGGKTPPAKDLREWMDSAYRPG
jgi:hypothetical protein